PACRTGLDSLTSGSAPQYPSTDRRKPEKGPPRADRRHIDCAIADERADGFIATYGGGAADFDVETHCSVHPDRSACCGAYRKRYVAMAIASLDTITCGPIHVCVTGGPKF